jgi:hypothetical protein
LKPSALRPNGVAIAPALAMPHPTASFGAGRRAFQVGKIEFKQLDTM